MNSGQGTSARRSWRVKKARAQRYLASARAAHQRLRDSAKLFFDARPFTMIAEPLSTENDKFVYRVRLVSRIPWRIRRDAARSLRTIRKLASALAGEIPEDSLLSQLRAHRVRFARSMLVPGVKADTVLVMDEESQMRNATVTAPQWDGKRQEITMVREDTDGALKGRLDVRFQLELADAPKLSGESVVALLGAAISEATEIIEAIEVTEVQVNGSDSSAEISGSRSPSPD